MGVEDAFPGMASTFSVEKLKWTTQQGSLITSVYFGTMAATRLGLIFAVKILAPEVLLFGHLVILIGSMVALIFAIDYGDIVMLVCTALFGLGQASIFASSFTWISRHIEMTGQITSLTTIGYFSGTMMFPPLIGALIQRKLYLAFPIDYEHCWSTAIGHSAHITFRL